MAAVNQVPGISPSGGANDLGALLAEMIKKMSDEDFAERLKHSSINDLMAIINNPGVPNDKKIAALAALQEAIPPSKSAASDTIGGDDETPEEMLKALLEKLKSKLADGGTMNAADSAQINAASQAVATSQSTASTTA